MFRPPQSGNPRTWQGGSRHKTSAWYVCVCPCVCVEDACMSDLSKGLVHCDGRCGVQICLFAHPVRGRESSPREIGQPCAAITCHSMSGRRVLTHCAACASVRDLRRFLGGRRERKFCAGGNANANETSELRRELVKLCMPNARPGVDPLSPRYPLQIFMQFSELRQQTEDELRKAMGATLSSDAGIMGSPRITFDPDDPAF